MNCYIVSSITRQGAIIHTRHYSVISAWNETLWRKLDGHTDIVVETKNHDVIYAGV